MRRYKSRIRCFYLYRYSSMDGRPRKTFGCLSVRRLLDVYVELETPSTSGEGERKFTESFNANSSHD